MPVSKYARRRRRRKTGAYKAEREQERRARV
jgi:hypothetical protein